MDTKIINDVPNSEIIYSAHGAGAGMDTESMNWHSQRSFSKWTTTIRLEFHTCDQIKRSRKKRAPDSEKKLKVHFYASLKKHIRESDCDHHHRREINGRKNCINTDQ